MKLLFAVLISVLVAARARMTGGPAEACNTMTPVHGNITAQTVPSGISITPSSTNFTCDSTIHVTLSGARFKGFLCQARTNPDQYSPTGYIDVGSHQNNCEGFGTAITHTDASNKTSAEFNWTPLGTPQNFYFVCTFVRDYDVFFVGEKSAMVSYTGQPNIVCGSCNVITQSTLFIVMFTAIVNLLF